MIVTFVLGHRSFILRSDHEYTSKEVAKHLRKITPVSIYHTSLPHTPNKFKTQPCVKVYVNDELLETCSSIGDMTDILEYVTTIHNEDVRRQGLGNKSCIYETREIEDSSGESVSSTLSAALSNDSDNAEGDEEIDFTVNDWFQVGYKYFLQCKNNGVLYV